VPKLPSTIPHARGAQGAQGGTGELDIRDQRAFGDFQFKPIGRHARVTEQPDDPRR